MKKFVNNNNYKKKKKLLKKINTKTGNGLKL